jgi:trimethylamine:corrinoid methyltransferase-like protein
MYRKAQEGIPVGETTMALDLIREVGIRGNFLGVRHTVTHYKEQTSPAFFQRGLRSPDAKSIKKIADEKVREVLSEQKLAVSEDIAAKIHEAVMNAEREKLHMKYMK